jgi:hypothetical protein
MFWEKLIVYLMNLRSHSSFLYFIIQYLQEKEIVWEGEVVCVQKG